MAQHLRVGAAVYTHRLRRHVGAHRCGRIDRLHGARDGAHTVVARHAFDLELDHGGTLLNGMDWRQGAATDVV
ncbi:hypothetical protein D3C72_1713380 [compost metagenome]